MSSEMAKKLEDARNKANNPNPSSQSSSSEEKPTEPSKSTEPVAQAGAERPTKAPASTRLASGHPHPQVLQNKHVCKIIDHSKDPSQVFPYLVKCSCGWESRVHDKNVAHETGEMHVARRGYMETPR